VVMNVQPTLGADLQEEGKRNGEIRKKREKEERAPRVPLEDHRKKVAK